MNVDTSTLYAALAATLVAAAWLLPVGFIRFLAYQSGSPDHTPGMRNIAIMALGLGGVCLVAAIVLALMIAIR